MFQASTAESPLGAACQRGRSTFALKLILFPWLLRASDDRKVSSAHGLNAWLETGKQSKKNAGCPQVLSPVTSRIRRRGYCPWFASAAGARRRGIGGLSLLFEDHRHSFPGTPTRPHERPHRCRLENWACPGDADRRPGGGAVRVASPVLDPGLRRPAVGPIMGPWAPRTKAAGKPHRHEGPGFGRILRQRSAWGTFFGLFSINYAFYFLTSFFFHQCKICRIPWA